MLPNQGGLSVIRRDFRPIKKDVSHKERDPYIDALRAIAIIRVVLYHVTYTGWLAIAFPSMGIMFALGGRMTAKALDAYGIETIRRRLIRILPAFWALGLILVPLNLLCAHVAGTPITLNWHNAVAWLFPIIDPQGAAVIDRAWRPLWYLRAYVWFVLLSPLVFNCCRRFLLPLAVAFLAALVPVTRDEVVLLYNTNAFGPVGVDLLTYGACWLIGMASSRSSFTRLNKWIVFGIAAIFAALAFRELADHATEVGRLDLYGTPVANAWWAASISLLLLRFRPGESLLASQRLQRMLRAISGRSLTIYLWHGLAIIAVTEALNRPVMRPIVDASWTPDYLGWVIIGTIATTALAAITVGRLEQTASSLLRISNRQHRAANSR